MRSARRPAISLPSADTAINTAAGLFASISAASTSTCGVRKSSRSVSATYTFSAPCAASSLTGTAGPTTTADGSPSARAAVNSS